MSVTITGTPATGCFWNIAEVGTAGNTTAATPQDSFKQGTQTFDIWTIGSGAAFGVAVMAGRTLTLSATPTTDDLNAGITTLLGTKIFAKIRGMFFWNQAAAESGFTVTIGAGASNGFTPFLGGTTPTLIVPANSKFVLYNNNIASWVVDSTHKTVKYDPGANTVAFTVGFLGE